MNTDTHAISDLTVLQFSKKYQLSIGIFVSLSIPMILLPVRMLNIQRNEMAALAGSELLLFLIILTSWISIRMLMEQMPQSQPWVRLLMAVLVCTMIPLAFYVLCPAGYFPPAITGPLSMLKRIVLIANGGFMIGLILIPLLLYFEKIQHADSDKEKLEILSQRIRILKLNALQSQLDPHFLFNSLNVLGISTQDARVKNYVTKLSAIYRHILRYSQGSPTASIGQEIQFACDYIGMITERFENGLVLNVDLTEDVLLKRIPVLSLQVLIENVVKHNVISPEAPLKICIYREQNFLVIVNDRHARREVYSRGRRTTRIGLKNLQERYSLITNTCIFTSEGKDNFTVKIPMI